MNDLTSHPDDATLLAHLAHELDEEKLEPLREHLASCEECVDRLLDLETLQPEAPREDAVDFELAAAWREIRDELPELADPAKKTLESTPRQSFFSHVGMLRVAAALLLVTTGSLALRTTWLEREMRTPRANVPVLYFDDVRSSDENEPIPADELAVIILTPGDPRPFDTYAIDLLGADDEVLEHISGLKSTEHGSLRFSLSLSRAPGRYSLKLFGMEEGEPVLLEDHPFEIRE